MQKERDLVLQEQNRQDQKNINLFNQGKIDVRPAVSHEETQDQAKARRKAYEKIQDATEKRELANKINADKAASRNEKATTKLDKILDGKWTQNDKWIYKQWYFEYNTQRNIFAESQDAT